MSGGEDARILVVDDVPENLRLLEAVLAPRREETAVLPVIMITSSTGPEKTQAIEVGTDDFIPKPLNHHELLVRVRPLLPIKRYHNELDSKRDTDALFRVRLSRRAIAR